MKKCLAIMNALFIIILMHNQFVFSQETWLKIYGGNYGDAGYEVQKTLDQGFIIIGVKNSDGYGSYDIFLIKTDSQGDTVWTKTYGGNNGDGGLSVKQLQDESYIATGGTYSYGIRGEMCLIKINSNGEMSWLKRYGEFGFYHGRSVDLTYDGGFIITGYGASATNGAYLIKANAQGDTIWTKIFNQNEIFDGYAVQQVSDSGFVLTGDVRTPNSEVALVKTDSNGNILWKRAFGESEYDCGYSVQETRDKGFIITGLHRPPGGSESSSHLYLIKTDSLGNAEWIKKHGSSRSYGKDVKETSDGGFIVTGHEHLLDKPSMYLVRTDTCGDTLWTRGFYNLFEGNSLVVTDDGAFVITGVISYAGNWNDLFLLKTNSQGILTGIDNKINHSKLNAESNNTYSLRCYPNPFNPTTSIEFSIPNDTKVTISVFNLLGRKVRTLSEGNRNAGVYRISWDGRDDSGAQLPAGVYLCRMKAGEFVKTIKMVLVR